MMKRRGFVLMLTTGLVALGLVVGSAIADELMGMITKIDVEGKQLTVVPKDSTKEIKVKVTDKTEVSSPREDSGRSTWRSWTRSSRRPRTTAARGLRPRSSTRTASPRSSSSPRRRPTEDMTIKLPTRGREQLFAYDQDFKLVCRRYKLLLVHPRCYSA